MSKKKSKSKSKKKSENKAESSEKSPSLVGCTSANFHEAARSEYLAHYVFSSFGTSVPVPRQEDTGLDLVCSLCERKGQRIWPIASYSVQVKSTNEPWVFADPQSIKWLVEYPLPIFFCVVDKKTTTINIFHTSPRFHAWVEGAKAEYIELIPGSGTDGFGHPWGEKLANEETPVIPADGKYSLSAPIASFTIVDILDSKFHSQVKQVLHDWVQSDRRNILRIQAGTRQFQTFTQYQTNNPSYTRYSTYSRNGLKDQERDKLLLNLVEQAKQLSQYFSTKKDWQGFLHVEMLLRHLDVLNYVDDGAHGYHLYSKLRKLFEATNSDPNGKFYGGLDGLRAQIKALCQESFDFADAHATKFDSFMVDPTNSEAD